MAKPTISALLPLLVVSYAFCNNGQVRRDIMLHATPAPKQDKSIHLISLPPKDDTFSLPVESLIRECWKWKDGILGDGRDYFVPRPKSLKAFHSLFVGMEIIVEMQDEVSLSRVTFKLPSGCEGQAQPLAIPLEQFAQNEPKMKGSYTIEECVALSNCARLEVILVLKENQLAQIDDVAPEVSKITEQVARTSVAFHLWHQIQSHRSKHSSFLQKSGLTSWLDLPDAVNTSCMNSAKNAVQIEESNLIMQLSQRFTCIEGARPICTHLSLIASGLAPRTNRSDREVIFRPYSSRDAHILLQLKRTAEVVSTLYSDKRRGVASIKILLDAALSAGKAARNEQIVPEIRQLKEFGSNGTPTIGLAKVVAEAAVQRAVHPTVDQCIARLNALGAANKISMLRQRVQFVVDTLADCDDRGFNRQGLQRVANELLHVPTMQLRSGEMSGPEMEDVVKNIETELKAYITN